MALCSGKLTLLGFLKPLTVEAKHKSSSLADVEQQDYASFLSLIWPNMIFVQLFLHVSSIHI